MSIWDWIAIIGEILKLIAEGQSKQKAVESVASLFNVSVSDIWKHGGF